MSEKLLPCPFCGGEARLIRLRGCLSAKCAGDFTECAGATDYVRVALWNRRTPAPEGEACPTCNGVRPEFCSNAFHLASPVVPAPEGEVVAGRYRAKNRPHDNWRLADYDMAADWPNLVAEPLYASPVVPVGVSVDALAQEIRRVDGRHTLGAGALAEALLPFLAALRPTDTGANHD